MNRDNSVLVSFCKFGRPNEKYEDMMYCNESSTIHFRHQHFRKNNEGRGMFLQYLNNQRQQFTNETSTKTGCNVSFLMKKHVGRDPSGPEKQRER